MNWWNRLTSFLTEVRSEMKKTTWPTWKEVRGTTVVVIVTSFIFAVFLWIVDIAVRQVVGGIMDFFTA
ncbi:MAG: preprotein translocase subunit SecE [Acidobacteriota bacterium]